MEKLIILISGKLSSGKNTFADLLKEEIENKNIPVTIDYFAKPLKDMCKNAFFPLVDYLNNLFLILIPYIQDEKVKENIISLITQDENWYENKNEITRRVLQAVGTDVVKTVNINYWVESFCIRSKQSSQSIIINSDARFWEEIDGVASKFKTIKIRIERDMNRHNPVNEHISEKALDNYTGWDHIIYNNGTLDELRKKAKEIAKLV